MNAWWALGLTLVLLAANGVFVASEFALISARRTQIEPLANEGGSRAARLTLRAMENVTVAMAAAQLGITLCSIGLGAVSEPAVAQLLSPLLADLRLSSQVVHPLAFTIALAFVVLLHVVYAEMVPKNMALAGPERAALLLGPFMVAVVVVLKPFVGSLNWLASHAVRLVGVEPREEVTSTFSHDEVAELVEESRREGLLDDDEYDLVTGALDFRAGNVVKVLLPLSELVTIPRDASPVDVEQACARTGFSRFPVADGTGDLVGYLHIKDVLETDDAHRRTPIADKWVRPLATVGVDAGLDEALRTMQGRSSHMARVADARGRVRGVVMLEDVLEELVGEVRSAR